MVEQAVTIPNKLGLHARPAALFVQAAARFRSTIVVSNDDLEVNGKSIMGVLMLAAGRGSTVIIRAEGEDSEEAVHTLVTLVETGFDEE